MLEEHFEREYPISLEDTSTGFILKGDSGSEFYFNKIQSEDEIEKILSGCEVDFSYCSDKVKEITLSHVRKMLRGEADSWVIRRINPLPDELHVEICIPVLEAFSDCGFGVSDSNFGGEYFSETTRCDIRKTLDEWNDGCIVLNFALPSDMSLSFHKKSRQGSFRTYTFFMHIIPESGNKHMTLYVRDGNGFERDYNFWWKDASREIMIAMIHEENEL